MRPQIRRLRIADFDSVKEIEKITLTEYRNFLKLTGQKDGVNAFISPRFLGHYARKRSSFVATEGKDICGFILAQPLPYWIGQEKIMWLEYVAVLPKYRRIGIATKLVAAVINLARNNGIRSLHTTVNPNNPESQRLLRKLGFAVIDWKVATKNPR